MVDRWSGGGQRWYEVRGGRALVRGTVAVRGVNTRQYE
ncbi:hypothetical protein Tco_0062956, partial [Tanacetum coccineum]